MQQPWTETSNNLQSQLPIPPIRKGAASFTFKRFSECKRMQKPWRVASKFITLGLFIQVAIIQAFNNSDPRKDLNNETTSNLNAGFHQKIAISELLRQRVLLKFDVISADLKELANMFRLNAETNRIRVVRSLPLDEFHMCDVEHATLIQMRDQLQETLNGTRQASNSTCALKTNSDNCGELINLLLCGYDHFKNGFIAATENIVARYEAINLKMKLSEFQEKSSKLFDAKIRSVSQKYNLEIQRLKTDMEVLRNLLNKIIDDLDAQTVKSSISEIASGHIESAAADFEKLKDGSKLQHIVGSVYVGYGHLDQVENLINFIKRLPRCSQQYPFLFEEMRKHDHLTRPQVLILADAVEECMPNSILESELNQYACSILEEWVEKLRRYDFEQMEEFAKNYKNIFMKYFSRILDRAYKIIDIANILGFIQRLEFREAVYLSLYNTIKSRKDLDSVELLILANRVKEDMQNNSAKYFNSNLKNKFTRSVRDLIWNSRSNCTIKNAYSEYLYTSDWWNGYTPYTWQPQTVDIQGYWELKLQDYGKFFEIKNIYYDRYLYSTEYIDENSPSYTYTKSPDKLNSAEYCRTYFKLIPKDERFLIRPLCASVNLYPINTTSSRRAVYGRKPSMIYKEEHMKWDIHCY